MGEVETEEWEVEILASIRGKEKTSDLALELVELLTRYPYTYFDMKLTPCKPTSEATEKWRIRAQHQTKEK
jgi:hypothetical protein